MTQSCEHAVPTDRLCYECAIRELEARLARQEADFEARSMDYHETITRLAAERNIAWAQVRALQERLDSRKSE